MSTLNFRFSEFAKFMWLQIKSKYIKFTFWKDDNNKKSPSVYWLHQLLWLSSTILFHAIKNYFWASNLGLIFTIWFVRSTTFQVLQIKLFKWKYNEQKLDLESQVKCFDHKGWSKYCTILRQVSPNLSVCNRIN